MVCVFSMSAHIVPALAGPIICVATDISTKYFWVTEVLRVKTLTLLGQPKPPIWHGNQFGGRSRDEHVSHRYIP